jgi:hypothetical protein
MQKQVRRPDLVVLGLCLCAASYPLLSFSIANLQNLLNGNGTTTLSRDLLIFGLLLTTSGVALIARSRLALAPLSLLWITSGARWLVNASYVFPSPSGRSLEWQGLLPVWATQQFLIFIAISATLALVTFTTQRKNAL